MRSKARFAISLSLAAILGAGLIWMALGGARAEYVAPGGALVEGKEYLLNGLVAQGAPRDVQGQALSAEGVRFTVVDQDDPARSIVVSYRGTVPDTFQDGREIVLNGTISGGQFVGKPDTLVAKCPSKFQTKSSPNSENT
jgi:cytochrome c-type biogenesis protein CcmE